jgi:hypothetical protein
MDDPVVIAELSNPAFLAAGNGNDVAVFTATLTSCRRGVGRRRRGLCRNSPGQLHPPSSISENLGSALGLTHAFGQR